MAMRISTRSIMGNYNRNLNRAIVNLDNSRNKVLTNRQFNAISEDPSSASKAFKLWREYGRTTQQLENVENTQALFDNISEGAYQVSDILSQQVTEDMLRSINGATSPETRKTFAKTLRGMQETMVLAMNNKYGDKYLYGGEKVDTAPFKLEEDGRLTFRGVDVNPPKKIDNPKFDSTKPEGPNNQKLIDNPDYEPTMKKLKEMAGEQMFVDFGFGIETDGVNNSSAFDTAVSGLNVLGYGQDENGMPNNVVVLIGQMADALENNQMAEFSGMTDKYVEATHRTADYVAELGTKAEFLENLKTKLTSSKDTINKEIISVEDADMPGAISSYVYQQYAYNAALKVGQSILSQSFIDFMR